MGKYYIVEEFFAEYKLNRDDIIKAIATKNEPLFNSLWPEGNYEQCISLYLSGSAIPIPETIVKRNYIIQSPKDDRGNRTGHFSVNEIMLSGMRDHRNECKANAKKSTDRVEKLRWNSMQLGVKQLMNSQYGVTGNPNSPLFEPDIGAAVTMGGRQCVQFLTHLLESTHEFYIDNITHDRMDLPELINAGIVTCQEVEYDVISKCIYEDPNSRMYTNARLWRLVNNHLDNFMRIAPSRYYIITIKPSTVIYQDTDSNYYENASIKDVGTMHGTNVTPETIDKTMHLMLLHNRLISVMVEELIGRIPLATGFEGSFIVERLLPKKKSYYGVQWSPDGDAIPSIKDITPKDNGEYVTISESLFQNQYFNIEDVIKKQHVKCTGVDIVRRDKFPFVNFIHSMVLVEDMKWICKNKDGEWVTCLTDDITSVIKDIINRWTEYCTSIQHCNGAKNFSFPLVAYVKTNEFNQDKNNNAKAVQENHLNYIKNKKHATPQQSDFFKNGDIIRYVVRRPESSYDKSKVSTRYMMLDDLYDDCQRIYGNTDESKLLTLLDFKYYTETVIKSLVNYIVNEDSLGLKEQHTDKEFADAVKNAKTKLIKTYMEEIFGKSITVARNYKTISMNDSNLVIDQRVINNMKEVLKINVAIEKKMKNGLSVDELRSIRQQLERYSNSLADKYQHVLSVYHYKLNRMDTKMLMFDDIPEDVSNKSINELIVQLNNMKIEYDAIKGWLSNELKL